MIIFLFCSTVLYIFVKHYFDSLLLHLHICNCMSWKVAYFSVICKPPLSLTYYLLKYVLSKFNIPNMTFFLLIFPQTFDHAFDVNFWIIYIYSMWKDERYIIVELPCLDYCQSNFSAFSVTLENITLFHFSFLCMSMSVNISLVHSRWATYISFVEIVI